MGQAIRGVSGSSPLSGGSDDADAPKAPSIGRYLSRQRKLRGMDLDELVAVTRIPRRSLERLESGAFDGLSDGFVRGFVRTVAQAIGLDPDEAVARLLVEPEFDPRRRWPRAPVLIAIAVGLGMLAAIGAVVTARLEPTAPSDPSGPSAPAEVVTPDLIRRDPVRALAEE